MAVRHTQNKPRLYLIPQVWQQLEESRHSIERDEVREALYTWWWHGVEPVADFWEDFAVSDVWADTLVCVTRVAEFGATKYADHNWLEGPHFRYSQLAGSMLRHRIAHMKAQVGAGEYVDAESGLPHLWHEAWGVYAIHTYIKFGLGVDDRPKIK